MADKTRKAVQKRVGLPNGSHVNIPCLERIPFSVAADQYQEHILYLRNGSGDTNRKVHIRDVPNLDNSAHIQVERIDQLPVKTMAEQAQERIYYVKNLDPPPILPDGSNDPAHEKVHYVRYFQNNDLNSDVWVDVELIDRLKVTVAAEQYQEWILYLRHDEPGNAIEDPGVNYGPVTVGFCDPAFDRVDSVEPYRFDPFQNIIQFNDAGTTTEAFDAVLIRPIFGAGYASGGWTIWDNGEAFDALADGFAYLWGGATGINLGHLVPGDEDIDMRFVDQWGEPKTYDNTGTGALGTGDVRGYTHDEWTIGFSPPPGYPSDLTIPGLPILNGLWWQQLHDYHPPSGQAYPNQFDFPDYGFTQFLGDIYVAWRDGAGTPGQLDNPTPVIICRLTAIGSSTTANPSGRY